MNLLNVSLKPHQSSLQNSAFARFSSCLICTTGTARELKYTVYAPCMGCVILLVPFFATLLH